MKKRVYSRKWFPLLAVNLFAGAFLCSSAWAVPVNYSFTTSNATSIASEVAPYFDISDSVSGTFTYDPNTPASGTVTGTMNSNLDGGTDYNGSFSNLSGAVHNMNFSDPSGTTIVMNDSYSTENTDLFDLMADTPAVNLSHNFSGFTVGDYTLADARLWWLEGQNSIPDFLDNQSLLQTLPSLQGIMALDFISNDLYQSGSWTGSDKKYVFFDGLTVHPSPVPEPATMLLFGTGLVGLAGTGLRRKKNA